MSRLGDWVWADEGGRALRVSEIDAGHVRVEIIEMSGAVSAAGGSATVIAGVTLGRWRWDRIARLLAPTDGGGA